MQTVKYVVQTDDPRKILPVFSYFWKTKKLKGLNVIILIILFVFGFCLMENNRVLYGCRQLVSWDIRFSILTSGTRLF